MVSLTSCTASLTVIVSDDGGSSVTSRGVVWSTSPNPTITSSKVIEGNGKGSFSTTLPNLAPNTTYYMRAFATNDVGTGYGSEIKVTTFTGTAVPTVTTIPISDISSTSAKSGGIVTGDCGSVATVRGVVWSTSPNPTISLTTKTTNGSGIGSFTSSLTGLTPNTTYYVKAYATNSSGTGYGNELTFKTNQNCSPNPVLSGLKGICKGNTTLLSSNVSGGIWSSSNPSIATINPMTGSVTGLNKGCAKIDYFLKGTNGCPDVNSSVFITIDSIDEPNITEVNLPICVGKEAVIRGEFKDFSIINPSLVDIKKIDLIIDPNPDDPCPLEGRTINNYILTGKKNGFTTITMSYGGKNSCPIKSITKEITVLSCSKPTVTALSISSITSTTVSLGGNVTSDGGASVTSRGVVWSTSPNPTIALTTKTSNGTGTGSFTSSITNLSQNTTYYFKAYATNSVGTGYSDESTFTTKTAVTLPTVSTISVSSITPTTASSGGNVTSDGGSLVSSRGIVWSIYSRPTISLSTKTNNGTGLGSFSSSLIGLSPNTTYYVRAYATNSVGTGYGEELRFIYNSLPTVVTISIDTFESIFLKYTGKVLLDGGSPIIERGVVLNNCGKPTLPFNQNDLDQINKDRLFTDSHEHKSHNDADTYEISRKNLEIKGNEKKRFEKIKVQFSESSIEQEINVEIENGLVFWSDDILLFSEKEFDLIKLEKGNIHSIKSLRWPNGIIPYSISNNHSNANDILEAIKITNNQTNINLIPRTNETNYVEFVEEDKNRCFAIIGMAGGRQKINVNNCGIATIIHEIGHALGMWHEHQRNDRDDFITIQYENIIDDKKHNFDKKLANILSIGQYDYESIMHYGTFAFTKNSMPTISIKSPPAAPGTSIGQRSGLSVGDIFAINSIYKNKSNCVSIYYPNDKGLGDFSGFLYNLNPNQKYFLRTYATNSTGTGYGNEISFTTKLGLPILSTLSIDSLSSINVKSGGNITLDGGSSIIARGVVWSTNPLPTIELSTKTTDGIGKGTFLSSITNLKPNTTYYLRGYATNESGTGYGNEITFTTSRIGHPCSNAPNIKDIDGNTYNTVQIGNQCWTKENLRVTKFNDGTSILLDTSGGTAGNGIGQTWSSLTKGARTIYAHSQTNLTTYGYLYNWYAAKGIATAGSINYKNICPKGWHVPNDSEWTNMIQVLDNTTILTALGGQSNIAGSKLKSTGTTLWAFPNANSTNESGFTALPSGNRFFEGNFNSISIHAIFWSASESYNNFAWSRLLYVHNGSVIRGYQSMSYGYSIRCLKD